MASRVRQVVLQTTARVFQGLHSCREKSSVCSSRTPGSFAKAKQANPPNGKLVRIQEAENQTSSIMKFSMGAQATAALLLPVVEAHERILGRVPRLVAAYAGFYSQAQERAAQHKGVKWVAVPNRSTRSPERKKLEKNRWFKKAQSWRTGCEGRISVLKCRHGLSRCRYRGVDGMKRWVGFGVIADNLINIGNVLAVPRA